MLSENKIQKKTFYNSIDMEFLEKAKLHRESRFVIVIKRESKWHEELLGGTEMF